MTDEAVTQTEDTGTTVEGAAEALGKAREAASQEDRTRQPEPDDTAPDATATPQESPPDQQEAAADAEQQTEPDAAQPTIEAPSWFNAEERELFAALPPEQQQAVQRLAHSTKAAESRRQNEYQAKLAEIEQVQQAAAQTRQFLESQLQHFRHPVEAAFRQQFADVLSGHMDLFRLSQTDRWPAYQAFQEEFKRIGQMEQELSHHRQQEQQALMQQHVETRNAQLIEAKPELKDPAKFEQYDREITDYLRGFGIPDERIAQVNFKELSIVEKAMKWDAAQKAKANVPRQPQAGPGQKVIPSHIRSMPKVLKPGTPNNAGAHDEKIAATRQQLRKSGSVDDAAALLRTLRSQLSA